MATYTELLGNISPTAQGARRAADIVAALAPPDENKTALVKKEQTTAAKSAALSMVPGVVGAGVGALVWGEHRVLGALAGHAVASNALPLLRGGAARKRALCRLAVEGAGVVGALVFEKHPVIGWVAGIAAGVAVTAFVDGSPTRELWNKLQSER